MLHSTGTLFIIFSSRCCKYVSSVMFCSVLCYVVDMCQLYEVHWSKSAV